MQANETESKLTHIPPRILTGLLSALSAGVVPRVGAAYTAIGRTDEIASLCADFDKVRDGGGAIRFLIGRYGSGKTFLIQLMRQYALDRGFVTSDCDLSPERRLSGSGGEGLATYRELIKNLATKASPAGGALPQIIARWFSLTAAELASRGLRQDTPEYDAEFSKTIFAVVRQLEGYVGGFDFAYVINEYYRAMKNGNDDRVSACIRWLRGEYANKTEAREALSSRSLSIINDDNWYDHLKLLCAFVRMLGYSGLIVFIDECVNLYKISNRISRESNYEKLLSIFNDIQSGAAEGLEFIFGGTPQFLEDTRRGLFSYEALRSRLSDGRFANTEAVRIMSSPVIRLRRLSDSELLALLMRLTSLHAQKYDITPAVTEENMSAFLSLELSRAGADELLTPREIIRDYLNLLDVMRLSEGASFDSVMASAAKPSESAKSEADKKPNTEGVRTITIADLEM